MRILHVIDSLNRGGAERMLVEIANASAREGRTVGVCVTRDGHALAADLDSSIQLWRLGRRHKFDLRGVWGFRRILVEFRPDLLHVHSRSSVAFLLSCGFFPQPVLLHDHFGGILLEKRVPLWFRCLGRHRVAAHVGVSEELRTWALAAGLPERRTFVIGNSMNLRPFLNARGGNGPSSAHRKVLTGVAVAGWRPEKGLHVLVDALASIETRTAWRLTVAGKPADPEYVARCRQSADHLGLADKLEFVGEVDDIPALLADADFGVVPSISESGPLVLIELMASCVPFVATAVGDVARLAAGAGAVEFVPPDDAAEMAGALTRLLELSDAARSARGREGRPIARERFDINAAMPRWNEIYRGVASGSLK